MLTALLLQAATPLPPLPPLHGGPAPFTCPVGGEQFSAWQRGTYSTYGERPDGRPYSYLPFPLPLPECPTNHLVVFDDFSPAELTRLEALIASPEYGRLVADRHGAYYRGYWLAERVGRPPALSLGLLLAAGWSVSSGGWMDGRGDPERAESYQRAFAAAVERLPADTAANDRAWLEARAANALRQVGEFGRAEAMRRRALATAGGRGDWSGYLKRLGPVIRRRDRSVEPLDMIPAQQVAFACGTGDRGGAFDRAVCSRPDVAAKVAGMRAVRPSAPRP